MKLSEMIETIRNEFILRIERKTGWGKHEVQREFQEAIEVSLIVLAGDPNIEE